MEQQRIDLTPAGFLPTDPKAEENIDRANKAVEERDHVAYQLADLLTEIVDDLGGIESLAQALISEGGVDTESANEKARRFWSLNKRRRQLDEELLRAMGGLPKLRNQP